MVIGLLQRHLAFAAVTFAAGCLPANLTTTAKSNVRGDAAEGTSSTETATPETDGETKAPPLEEVAAPLPTFDDLTAPTKVIAGVPVTIALAHLGPAADVTSGKLVLSASSSDATVVTTFAFDVTDPAAATMSFTPLAAGSATVRVTATHAAGTTLTKSFVLAVAAAPCVVDPTLLPLHTYQAASKQAYHYQFFKMPDGSFVVPGYDYDTSSVGYVRQLSADASTFTKSGTITSTSNGVYVNAFTTSADGTWIVVGADRATNPYVPMVARSTDQGATWSKQTYPITNYGNTGVTAVVHVGNDVLLMMGYGYEYGPNKYRWITWRSTDAGASWSIVDNYALAVGGQTYPSYSVPQVRHGKVFMAGYGNALNWAETHWLVRVSSDGGLTWSVADDVRVDDQNSWPNTIVLGDDQDVYVLGYHYTTWQDIKSVIRKSADDGQTWTTLYQGVATSATYNGATYHSKLGLIFGEFTYTDSNWSVGTNKIRRLLGDGTATDFATLPASLYAPAQADSIMMAEDAQHGVLLNWADVNGAWDEMTSRTFKMECH